MDSFQQCQLREHHIAVVDSLAFDEVLKFDVAFERAPGELLLVGMFIFRYPLLQATRRRNRAAAQFALDCCEDFVCIVQDPVGLFESLPFCSLCCRFRWQGPAKFARKAARRTTAAAPMTEEFVLAYTDG